MQLSPIRGFPANVQTTILLAAVAVCVGLGGSPAEGHGETVPRDGSSPRSPATPIAGEARAGLPAFPGAEGWGAETPGGRGGEVLIVDSLADDGSPGTLRWAVEQPYPRIVVFRIAGIIELRRPLWIGGDRRARPADDNLYSYLTIAGQSAPGGGIVLTGFPIHLANDVHDVVIRYLRVRNTRVDRREGSIGDGVGFFGAHHVVLDHVSVSWMADEGISLESSDRRMNHDVTVQYSLVAEGLLNGGHPSGGPHSRCIVVSDGSHRVSLHHNMMISCNRRNPSLAGNSELGSSNEPVTDVRYNVAYNFGDSGLQVGRGALTNVVGNLLRYGPDTIAPAPIDSNDRTPEGTVAYLADNCVAGAPGAGVGIDCPAAQETLVAASRQGILPEIATVPFEAPDVTPSRRPERCLLKRVGALPRDPADDGFLRDYRSRGGELGAGGLSQDQITVPEPDSGSAPADADRDGMADDWESDRGLDPGDPLDAALDTDGDGYTEIEEYLQELAEDLARRGKRACAPPGGGSR